jgi:hypothetical protein
MPTMTTVKVSIDVRDELKSLADRNGVTIEAAIRRLLRTERQRQMGLDLAERGVTEDDRAIIRSNSLTVARALG